MSYIDDIFARLNIQHLREFLLHGVECAEISPLDYRQRVQEAWGPVSEALRSRFPEPEEYEKVTGHVQAYAGATENVSMEIGMRCGAILIALLLGR